MDTRFSELFNVFLQTEYGIPQEDFTLQVVGETLHYYYLEVFHAGGLDQIVYNKDNRTWQYIN